MSPERASLGYTHLLMAFVYLNSNLNLNLTKGQLAPIRIDWCNVVPWKYAICLPLNCGLPLLKSCSSPGHLRAHKLSHFNRSTTVHSPFLNLNAAPNCRTGLSSAPLSYCIWDDVVSVWVTPFSGSNFDPLSRSSHKLK